MPDNQRTIFLAYVALIVSPLFFSTNVIFGRAATDIAPFTLAFLRWSISGFILMLLCRDRVGSMLTVVRQHWHLLLLLGFLGMFICGGMVYFALHSTTATNGTLIYTIPPVIIILIERIWRNRPLKLRESVGVCLAILGVAIIVARGSWQTILSLDFNLGDLLFLAAAVSWAIYSVVLKSNAFAQLGTLSLFALVAVAGALVLLPAAGLEYLAGAAMPNTSKHWITISAIVLLSSLIAFSTFQHGIRILGASIAGIFMYLLPVSGVTLAWFFLGETIHSFHLAGIITILSGVILATFPTRFLQKKGGRS